MATNLSDIIRPAGDTYPSKTTIRINGVPIDLTGWNVDVRYKKGAEEYIIDCVITDNKNGRVNIYPHGVKKIDHDEILDPKLYITSENILHMLTKYSDGNAINIGILEDGTILNNEEVSDQLKEIHANDDTYTVPDTIGEVPFEDKDLLIARMKNQVWDEDEAGAQYPYYLVRWKQYPDGYVEEMTHASGMVRLTSRFPI